MTLLLGVVGVYGVIADVVAQRRREVGIRLALGATGQDVVRLFLGRGLVIVAIGLAIGTIAAVAGLAIWLPARQAATTQPGIILRG